MEQARYNLFMISKKARLVLLFIGASLPLAAHDIATSPQEDATLSSNAQCTHDSEAAPQQRLFVSCGGFF